MYHGSVKRVPNGYYSSNMLQLILQFKFPSKTATRSSTQLSMKRSAKIGSEIMETDEVFNHVFLTYLI